MQNTIIEQVVCLNLDCSIWSGRKKLTPSDFKLTGSSELPPSDLASLGSKKICNPDTLKVFDTLKKEAHREASRIGVRFLGGYAIASSKAEELCKLLDDIRERFTEARDKFIKAYDSEIDEWVAKHPGWQESIRSVVPAAAYVESRIGFEYQAFEVRPTGVAEASLDRAVSGLAGQLYHEVAKEAFDYYDISLCGKPYGTQKTLRPLRSIRSKLDGLSFIDGKVGPIISMIDHVLASMPTTGRIEGPDLAKLVGVVHVLSDKDRMITYGERLLNGATPSDLFAQEEEEDVVDVLIGTTPTQADDVSAPADTLSLNFMDLHAMLPQPNNQEQVATSTHTVPAAQTTVTSTAVDESIATPTLSEQAPLPNFAAQTGSLFF